MKPVTALPGDRYGRLVVYKEGAKTGRNRRVWCHCDCGNTTILQVTVLTQNLQTDCGHNATRSEKRRAEYDEKIRSQRISWHPKLKF